MAGFIPKLKKIPRTYFNISRRGVKQSLGIEGRGAVLKEGIAQIENIYKINHFFLRKNV